MKVYSAKIILGGSLGNEVRRDDLTAPEVLVLKHIHGPEHVTEVKYVKDIDRTDTQERIRLLGDGGEILPIYKHEQVRAIFPSDLTPFPKELPPEMIDVAGMAIDLNKAAGKPIEDMTDEEITAELDTLQKRQKNMAKARAVRAANAEARKAAAAEQAATLD